MQVSMRSLNLDIQRSIVRGDQFINVTIEGARKTAVSNLPKYSDLPIRWTRRNGELVLDHRENRFSFTF